VIVLLATWILRVVIHTSAKEADPIDITKLSFTVAGGVGAAVEQGRFVERFGDHDVAAYRRRVCDGRRRRRIYWTSPSAMHRRFLRLADSPVRLEIFAVEPRAAV
jgi:hypothetical protein